jgi:hypothetical protein
MPKNRAVRAPQRAAIEAGTARANQKAAGVTSLRGIAAPLDERGVPTVAGSGRRSHTQVARVPVDRACEPVVEYPAVRSRSTNQMRLRKTAYFGIAVSGPSAPKRETTFGF